MEAKVGGTAGISAAAISAESAIPGAVAATAE
jgi:hypothetical protein